MITQGHLPQVYRATLALTSALLNERHRKVERAGNEHVDEMWCFPTNRRRRVRDSRNLLTPPIVGCASCEQGGPLASSTGHEGAACDGPVVNGQVFSWPRTPVVARVTSCTSPHHAQAWARSITTDSSPRLFNTAEMAVRTSCKAYWASSYVQGTHRTQLQRESRSQYRSRMGPSRIARTLGEGLKCQGVPSRSVHARLDVRHDPTPCGLH